MPSSDRKNWATYAVIVITVAVCLAVAGVVAWRTSPRSWQQMAEDAEQESKEAQQEIDAAFANVSEEETLPVRKRLERAMAESDANLVAGDLDLDLQTKIVFLRMNVVGAQAERLMPSVVQGSDREALSQQLLGEAMQGVRNGGSYEFLRTRRQEGRTTAVYRIAGLDGRVNYHEWAFARSADGKVRIADLYIYASGEWLTDTMGRMLEIGRVADVRLTPMERAEADANAERMAQAALLARTKDWKAVDAVVAELPEELREEKLVLVLQAVASSDDVSRFRKDLARLEERYPDDVATALLGHGLCVLDGRYDDAMAALNVVDDAVGGDPYLAALRTEVLVLAGRFSEARSEGERAVAMEHPPPNLYMALAYANAAETRFDEAVDCAVKYVDATPTSEDSLADFEQLLNDEVWQALFRSPEWRSQRESE